MLMGYKNNNFLMTIANFQYLRQIEGGSRPDSLNGKNDMRASDNNGFSLIEVLISVFVLTVGVIGALGMHMTALRTTQQSVFQSNAQHLAIEMADKMRTNVDQMHSSDEDNPYLQIDYQSASSVSDSVQVNCYNGGNYCNAQQLAQFDIAEWLSRVDTALPGGRVRICRDAAPWDAAMQTYDWNCSSSMPNAPIVIKIGWPDKSSQDASADDRQSFAPSVALMVASAVQ
jgi:type IV pilus assembly protein PilV